MNNSLNRIVRNLIFGSNFNLYYLHYHFICNFSYLDANVRHFGRICVLLFVSTITFADTDDINTRRN